MVRLVDCYFKRVTVSVVCEKHFLHLYCRVQAEASALVNFEPMQFGKKKVFEYFSATAKVGAESEIMKMAQCLVSQPGYKINSNFTYATAHVHKN